MSGAEIVVQVLADEGVDTVQSALFQINLSANVENLTYTGAGTFTGVGNASGNVITGGTQRDVLLGLDGNDVLIGGAGAPNELYGGAGDDRYVLSVADSIIEGVGDGVDTVETSVLAAYNLGANVENLTNLGSQAFRGTGNALDNVLTGGSGDDLLAGQGGVDTLVGGIGIDTADYSLAAGAVHARLDTMSAIDDGDGATDAFTSIEAITGSAFNDLLVGGTLGDRLSGGLGADTLLGFGGNDILAGGQGGANELHGGQGDDFYILDALDTVIEQAGEGFDVIEAHVGAHIMGANIENMFYVGFNKFYGTGNAGNNVITGGIGEDILKGMGGDDVLNGGSGTDEVQFRGAKAQYTVTTEGAGYRILDTVGGRDGSTYVDSIETLRFMEDSTVTLLTYPPVAPGALETTDKAAGEDFGGPVVSTLMNDPEVQPMADDDVFVSTDFDGPQILPGAVDDGLQRLDFADRLAMWRMQADGETNPLIVHGPDGLFIRLDGNLDTDASPGFDPWG